MAVTKIILVVLALTVILTSGRFGFSVHSSFLVFSVFPVILAILRSLRLHANIKIKKRKSSEQIATHCLLLYGTPLIILLYRTATEAGCIPEYDK
jgi:hypothetical protein